MDSQPQDGVARPPPSADAGNGRRSRPAPLDIEDEKSSPRISSTPTSPSLSSPRHSASSPLLGNKWEGFFRPIRSRSQSRRQSSVANGAARPPVTNKDSSMPPIQEAHNDCSPYIDKFPTEPESLTYLPAHFWFILVDIGLTALPLVFIVYGILAACLHGRPTASYYFGDDGYNWSGELYGPAMLIVQNYIPTFFPMAYGVELVRLIQAFALWRVQSGTHLGFVEQLIGSTSLGGTIASLWGLSIINWVGTVLLALWALAPVGSQAGLRIISDNGTYISTTPLSYMNTDAVPTGLSTQSNEIEFYTYAVDAMYSTSVLTPATMASPQDPWANVKIPSLEWLERNSGCEASGWCSRSLAKERNGWNESVVTAGTWSSLTGLPVVGGQFGLGFQNFSMLASYYTLNCTSLESTDPTTRFNSTIPGRGNYDTSSSSAIWDSGNANHPNTFFVDTLTPLPGLDSPDGDARLQGADMAQRTILFGSRAPNSTTVAQCNVALSYVEAEVHCNFTAPLWNIDQTASGRSAAGACYVDRLRRDPSNPGLDPYTPFDQTYLIAQRFFGQWPLATGSIPQGTSSPTERFINDITTNSAEDSSKPILVATDWLGYNSTDTYVDISTLDLPTFTERFSLLFNTYWHSYCNLPAMTQSEMDLGFGALVPPAHVMFRTVDAAMSIAGQHFVINFAWLAVYMVCCLVALLAGALALMLRYRTLVPDVLGNFSMMIKDNPYTPLPRGGSTLDGYEFARHVMNMPVKLADVRPKDDVGYIALTSMDFVEDGDARIATVRKNRTYL